MMTLLILFLFCCLVVIVILFRKRIFRKKEEPEDTITLSEERYYLVYVVCNNCKFSKGVRVEKGIPVSELECPNCKVKALVPRERFEGERKGRKGGGGLFD